MTKDEALRLALEALEKTQSALARCMGPHKSEEGDRHRALAYSRTTIIAIKAALEAKDEPWEKFCDSHCVWTDHHPDCRLAKDEPVSQPKVRTGNCLRVGVCASEGHKIQSQRTWVGLTDEEIFDVWLSETPAPDKVFYQKLCRSIEVKLRSKNDPH